MANAPDQADVPYVMAQVGHTDPKMTLGVYAQVIASKTDHGAALDGLVEASEKAAKRQREPRDRRAARPQHRPLDAENPRLAGAFSERLMC